MASMYRITTVFSGLTGAPYYNQLVAVDNGTSTAQVYVDLVETFWTDCSNFISNAVSWAINADVDVFDDTTGAQTGIESTTGGAGAGLSADEPLPFATQGLLRLRTGTFVSGREIRGRIFIPGMTEVGNDSGKPTSGMIASLNGAGDTLESNGFYVYSPTRNTSAEIVSTSLWNQYAVLRSRRD
uniref:Uncharacterized protein n=1 Tax=uncultured prokaryote TaxID=198431 RepID=A0A0H5Q4N9_9ZZZZ|nr:hypothetical protein [uncultured prokaryote]